MPKTSTGTGIARPDAIYGETFLFAGVIDIVVDPTWIEVISWL